MSLFWIHCNRCYQRPASPEAKFYVTNCGHIYCRNCAGGVHKTKNCGACGTTNVGFVQIGPNMTPETKAGFKSTNDRLQEVFKKVEFQQMMYRHLIQGLKGQVKEARDMAGKEYAKAERYRTEREELKAALVRAEAAAAEAQQRLLQREQQQASSLPPRMALEAAAGISAEKRTTVNGRDGRTRKAASPNGLFRFPPAGSPAANGASGLRSPTPSLTGIVTSPPASRYGGGGGSDHSLPTATDFAGMEVVNNVFDPRTPAALRRTGISGVVNKVSGWLTSL